MPGQRCIDEDNTPELLGGHLPELRLSAAEALNAGITFGHDWCHIPRTPEHAEENLRALRESGIRAAFSYGPAHGMPVSQPVNLADIERLHGSWSSPRRLNRQF